MNVYVYISLYFFNLFRSTCRSCINRLWIFKGSGSIMLNHLFLRLYNFTPTEQLNVLPSINPVFKNRLDQVPPWIFSLALGDLLPVPHLHPPSPADTLRLVYCMPATQASFPFQTSQLSSSFETTGALHIYALCLECLPAPHASPNLV